MEGEASEVVTNHRRTKAFSDAVKAGYAKKLASGWTNPRRRYLTSDAPLDTRISFNVLTTDKVRWLVLADEFGMTISELMRMALMELDDNEEAKTRHRQSFKRARRRRFRKQEVKKELDNADLE